MFLDASALVAIIAGEDDAAALTARIEKAESAYTSPIAAYEAILGIARTCRLTVAEAVTALDGFMAALPVEIVPITAEVGRTAIEAFDRFGRGRHPARLNMGDCFAYACARSLGVALLCKGDDFPQTDIVVA